MSPEQMIGHYRITAKLGEGGMGEVYRAVDTKLEREVALKILPPAFASDSGRMARFEREAKVLASLNHPNIAAIYGVEERALVMELVEGASPKGPMPFDEAWKIASQIAAALEYAHDKGIVHRDLKPDNIKITPDGVVKLLDFGLAKAFTEQKEPSANPEHSPTLTIGATEVGVILGTAAYMAPEQAKGKSVDKRADIWAFGVVLYELLTGERLFKGEDAADTLAQVLTKEPQFQRVPFKARRLLQSCLEKEPKRRLRDTGDASRLIEEGVPAVARSAAKLPWAIAALAVGTAMAVAAIHFRETPPQRAVLRYTAALPEDVTSLHSFSISPDGRLIAIAAYTHGQPQLWLRALDELQIKAIPGTEGANYPFWSPDSQYVGFFAQGKLKKIAASGGPPQSLCDAPYGRGGTWNRENVILFTLSGVGGAAMRRVSAAGGAPTEVINTGRVPRYPVFLRDGQRFLYLGVGGSAEQNGVYLSSLDGKENRRVLADASNFTLAGGRVLFVRDSTLMARAFDSASGQLIGDAAPIAEEVSLFTASETGTLVYQGNRSAIANQMIWYGRDGKPLGLVGVPGGVLDPVISLDGKSIAFRRGSSTGSDIWIRDLARGTEQRFTTDALLNLGPLWSPTGDSILFRSTKRAGIGDLYRKATGGSGSTELLLATAANKVPNQWSHDGQFVVYEEFSPKTGWDIWTSP